MLIACEFSGTVRDAFTSAGCDATSCDLLPCERPGKHYQGDVRDILHDGWDMMIAHPPCTYLSSSGLHWNNRGRGWKKTSEALRFVQLLLEAPVARIALENPIGCINTRIRKPTQTIQPWQFGHNASKATCLWLKNLPPLKPTKYIPPVYFCCGLPLNIELVRMRGCPNCAGEKIARPRWANQTASGQNKLPPSEKRWVLRSLTYPGIAKAMAEQWGQRQFARV